MGVKGFQKGHLVSDETRAKISKANNGNFFAICDYCGKEYHTQKSAFAKRKRHFVAVIVTQNIELNCCPKKKMEETKK